MTKWGFASNHARGILGGISPGQDVVLQIAVKPTPSIERIQQTRDMHGKVVEISVKGRYDPCIVPLIILVAKAMLALVLADCVPGQGKYREMSP